MTIALDISTSSPSAQIWSEGEMSGSMVEVIGSSTTPRMARRSMALSDIDPKYVSQSGIWEASEVETSRGSIRIQHLTAVSTTSQRPSSSSVSSIPGGPTPNNPRFPKLEECAHFHYDCVELPTLKIQIRDDPSKPITVSGEDSLEKCAFSIEVVSGGQSWVTSRTHSNLFMLDEQLHRCVWDRTFSLLGKVQESTTTDEEHNGCREFVTRYLARLSELPTNKITCGTVLSWLELDNRGRHIVSSDDSAINTPAVAAACAVRKYVAQAADEISFEIGDMISVIDMPPPEESIWWRGKRGFHVGFFPRDYVQVIGDKVPAGLPIVPSVRRLQRLSVSSSSSSSSAPDKPVLRKHGKLIAFFRSFILSRPSRRRLKQSGILRERVFSCDLAEHLLNTGNEIPAVLNCCAEFIEKHGIIDGVYRLSGITSNIQKLRNAFDEDKVPNLEGDISIKQDIHAVSSLLKMYFRELPNPLCTYQLYEKFVTTCKESDEERLFKMREVVHELPPPHYRTLEYLMKHLSRVAQRSSDTGMTPKNMAIVWAPNLIRCRELEAGGVAALKGIGVQAVVTEYLIRHADLIFNDKLPANYPATTTVLSHKSSGSQSGRPKSLAISSPLRLMSLEEAQDKAKDDRKYIDVGGGPSSLPPKYHTVIELPSRRGGLKSKRSPMGWKHFFSRNRSFSKPPRKMFTPGDITVITRNMPVAGPQGMQTNWAGRLRPVKSVESLVSSPLYNTQEDRTSGGRDLDSESVMEEMEASLSKSSPATPCTTDVMFHPPPPNGIDPRNLNPKTHNRSISHDSYFEFGEFRNGNQVYIDETLEEETMSQSSKLSLELSSSGMESNGTSPIKSGGGGGYTSGGPQSLPPNSSRAKSEDRKAFKSPVTPPPSVASLVVPNMSDDMSTSSDDLHDRAEKSVFGSSSPLLLKPMPRVSKCRDSEVQTSQTKLFDVGVCTQEDSENLVTFLDYKSVGTETSSSCAVVGVRESTVKWAANQEYQCESGKYELDKNSSFDESSELSTPDNENFTTTNVIYSPLVNEISSTSSAEQVDQLHTTTAEVQVVKREVPINLFVCPLYEAGVTPSDFASSEGSTEEENSPQQQQKESEESQALQYEQIINQSDSSPPSNNKNNNPSSNIPSPAQINMPQLREVCHIYENERIYQNQPIPQPRKRPATIYNDTDIDVVKICEEGKLPEGAHHIEDLYSGEEHYENISETEYKVIEGNYEGNIYEDIDSESVNGGSGRYETIEVSSPDNQQQQYGGGSKNQCKQIKNNMPKSKEAIAGSDDDTEANYESVRFLKADDQLLPVAHHYSEIEEIPQKESHIIPLGKSPVSDDGSSPSHSRTDEMVTYLEVQTPSFNLRSDSLEDQKSSQSEEQSYESVAGNNESQSGTLDSPNSTSEEGEIRHIDSPVVVENPLYSLQIQTTEETESSEAKDIENNNLTDNENENDVSMNESISISISLDDQKQNSLENQDQESLPFESNNPQEQNNKLILGSEMKLLGRCNSAPLAETRQDFIITEILRQSDDRESTSLENDLVNNTMDNNQCSSSSDKNTHNNISEISLCKRLSEPSLLFSNNQTKTEDSSCSLASSAAWKLADAKRLANRKQSVKELLSKFETRDSPSPTNSGSSPGPGLPKPSGGKSPTSINNTNASSKGRGFGGGGSGRFQHHRFSVGDILMTQSMSSAEDLNSLKASSNTMVRSDTFPELRSEGSASKENVLVEISRRGSQSPLDGNGNSPLVTEKVQQALRVAMSSVDMNDPSTRERIEKYKEERRTFLRQKITSEISGQRSPSSDGKESPSPPTKKSPLGESESFSSIETIFSKITTCTTTTECNSNNSNNSGNNKTSNESPRKRAFSEDIPPAYINTTKAIKTETNVSNSLMSSSNSTESTKSADAIQEEINVKEKIALWTLQKKEMSRSTISCADIKETRQSPTGMRPVEKQFVKPILRREVTTSSIEISKSKLSRSGSRTESGKKIKDMAAFFEAKQF